MYTFNESIFRRFFKAEFGEDAPEGQLKVQEAISGMLVSAYNCGLKGESLTELCPWMVKESS